jgi:AcrR family transcriptional regulator
MARTRDPVSWELSRQRVLDAALDVFGEKGYDAATMTEIAARASAPIGSLYQFFPTKEALADSLVQHYIALLVADLQDLTARAAGTDIRTLVEQLFGLLRSHARARAAVLPLVESRMDERTRRIAFRHMMRKHLAAILRVRAPGLSADVSRELAVVVLQLMKAASALSDEEGLPTRAAGLRDLQAVTVQYLEQRLESACRRNGV